LNLKYVCLIAVLSISAAHSHEGVVSSAPFLACQNSEKTAECSYENDHGDLYIGSCRLFNTQLMCVRSKPIVKAESIKKSAIK
jgi:hypothetical protein